MDELRDFARDVKKISDWIFIAGLLWLAGFGMLVAAIVFHWRL